MPQVPLPTGIVGDRDIPELNEQLVNLFNPGDNTLLKTPGIASFSTGDGACRGAIDFEQEHYQISGGNLVKISSTGLKTVIDAISGTADTALAKSFISLMIVVEGGDAFSLDTIGNVTQITDPNFIPSIDVASINQRFVFVPEDGSPLFFTDPNSPTVIPALNFFDAELLPDKNTGVINLRNDLYVGGENSFEIFRDIGPINSPFQRVDGAAVETGYVAAKAIYKDTFVFLGRDREGAFAFHAMASGDAPKISNPAIEEILNQDYTFEELKTCTSQRFTWKGVDMVAFRLPRSTFLFYGSGWSFIQTGIDSSETIQPWDVKFMAFSYGKYLTGSATTTKIGQIDDIVLEFGEKIERQIDTFVKADPNSNFILDNLFLSGITGTSLVAGTIGLSISKDSLAHGPQVFRSLGEQGKHAQQLAWYGGLGMFESFCGIRLRTTADVNFSVDGLVVNG